ncbi:hypothetical protein KIN20_017476 [Parelaphostrongylus tenuis]|uniref:Uncharacterized protein n=1 Tax=Parelaphostrongylus tenuis TaxID=148309 RepID=A0AAD5N353_PARTN|nr:hypothetical protein KIN20_017476 [Parelaphostrongylus tenuis]
MTKTFDKEAERMDDASTVLYRLSIGSLLPSRTPLAEGSGNKYTETFRLMKPPSQERTSWPKEKGELFSHPIYAGAIAVNQANKNGNQSLQRIATFHLTRVVTCTPSIPSTNSTKVTILLTGPEGRGVCMDQAIKDSKSWVHCRIIGNKLCFIDLGIYS